MFGKMIFFLEYSTLYKNYSKAVYELCIDFNVYLNCLLSLTKISVFMCLFAV